MLLRLPAEDDDADQLDYGDEAGGKAVKGGMKKQPSIKEQQHDGVMLIPKWCVVSVGNLEQSWYISYVTGELFLVMLLS